MAVTIEDMIKHYLGQIEEKENEITNQLEALVKIKGEAITAYNEYLESKKKNG